MATERLLEIFGLLAQRERDGDGGGGGLLCSVAAQFLALDGASIALLPDSGRMTSLCTSNAVAASLLNIEITIGEGPASDACHSDEVVRVDRLADVQDERWLAFAPLAIAKGVQSVFAFPIFIGAVRLGVLTLYRWEPGALSDQQEADAYLMASVIARAVLDLQAGAPRGSLATQLERESNFDFTVHQAAGMVAVQGSLNVSDAMVALRAHAFATDQGLSALASNVVARRIRYDANDGAWYEIFRDEL